MVERKEEKEIMARVVVQRPDWGDIACKWGSYWLQEVVKEAKSHGFDVSDLYGSKATRGNVLRECKKSDFLYFSGVGHGNATTFTGQREQPIFWLGDKETKNISKNKHFNFLSCRFGRLGARWISRVGRAVGVHAYDADFAFIVDEGNFPDGYAKPFFDSHLMVDRELLKGSTHGEAHRACKMRYLYWAMRSPFICRRYLIWDMRHKRFYGRRWANIWTKRACIIATITLRDDREKLKDFERFKEKVLLRKKFGRLFMSIYHLFSVPLVILASENERFRKLLKEILVEPTWTIIKKNFNNN